MEPREIKPGILAVGANDWDRRMFDELIPLPEGTSYNSYLIEGKDKTALIDAVDPTKVDELLASLTTAKANKVDYVIANHAEQDHSGGLPAVLERFPAAKLVTNEKCKSFLMDLLHIPAERFQVVKDGEVLQLGGRTLEFLLMPWVHWPETMVTYLREDRILFSCDFFGSHLATSDLFACCGERLYYSAKRYYAEIMMPFRKIIRGHLEKLRNYQIELIAPSHGPIYDNPKFIMDAYRDWVSDDTEDSVVIAYISMHGSTKAMVDYLVNALVKGGINEVKPFNLEVTDIGELAMALVDARTVVIGSPTVLTGPHPKALYAAALAGLLRPKTKFLAIFGSYGWGGQMVDRLKGVMAGLEAEILDPVLVKGHPTAEGFAALDRLADEIIKRHQAINKA